MPACAAARAQVEALKAELDAALQRARAAEEAAQEAAARREQQQEEEEEEGKAAPPPPADDDDHHDIAAAADHCSADQDAAAAISSRLELEIQLRTAAERKLRAQREIVRRMAALSRTVSSLRQPATVGGGGAG
jgi:hypothetical protein